MRDWGPIQSHSSMEHPITAVKLPDFSLLFPNAQFGFDLCVFYDSSQLFYVAFFDKLRFSMGLCLFHFSLVSSLTLRET